MMSDTPPTTPPTPPPAAPHVVAGTGLRETLMQHGATDFVPFGGTDEQWAVALDFGSYEAEYAAIRQRVGVMALPHRGVLRLTGDDRIEFLQRLLTQNLSSLAGGHNTASYLLDDAGHILADLCILHGDQGTWLVTDAVDLPVVHEQLDRRLFAEDVVLDDAASHRGLALWGPSAGRLLEAIFGDYARRVMEMPDTHHVLTSDIASATVFRLDLGDVTGVQIWVDAGSVVSMHETLLAAAGWSDHLAQQAPDADEAQARRTGLRGRPVGWSAFNTVRVEQGLPRFHVDFGPDSTPAEIGTPMFEQYVSLNKGCYLGQEAVARTHNLSHPKRRLVQLALKDTRLPIAGRRCSRVTRANGGGGLGVVSSGR